MPGELFRLIRCCIKNGRSVSNNYQPDDGSSHEHFVSVLEEDESILSASKDEETKRAGPAEAKSASGPAEADGHNVYRGNIANRFATLSVDSNTGDVGADDEDDDKDDDDAEIVLPDPRGPSEVITRWHGPKRLFAPLLTRVDGLYTVLEFLHEVCTMRQHLKSVWQAYAAGKIDLVTASVTTNTGLETLQEADEDIMNDVVPLFDGFESMLATLLVALEAGIH